MSSGGTISGTPTVGGAFNYTVTVTDATGNTGTVNCSVTVQLPCSPGVIGGIDLRGIVDTYLFFFTDGRTDANWQGASKGFVGDVLVDGVVANERTSRRRSVRGHDLHQRYDASRWADHCEPNAGQALGSTRQSERVSRMRTKC